jgi:agmatinase
VSEQHVRYESGIVGQVDGMQVPRYAGLTTFARLPRREDVGQHDVAVVGVPFDSGVTYRPGARFGPAYIRQASRLLRRTTPPWTSARSSSRRSSTRVT